MFLCIVVCLRGWVDGYLVIWRVLGCEWLNRGTGVGRDGGRFYNLFCVIVLEILRNWVKVYFFSGFRYLGLEIRYVLFRGNIVFF